MKRALLFLALLGCLATSASAEEPTPTATPDFFMWVDAAGKPHFTDDVRHVPKRFDSLSSHTWAELRQKTDSHFTESQVHYTKAPASQPVAEETASPEVVDCSHPVTIKTDWFQDGPYYRQRYVITDACGVVRAITGPETYGDLSISVK